MKMENVNWGINDTLVPASPSEGLARRQVEALERIANVLEKEQAEKNMKLQKE